MMIVEHQFCGGEKPIWSNESPRAHNNKIMISTDPRMPKPGCFFNPVMMSNAEIIRRAMIIIIELLVGITTFSNPSDFLPEMLIFC